LTIAAVALALVFAVRAQEPPYRDNLALFTRAVQISPNSAAAWDFLGDELMRLGRSPEGIAAFRRAQALEPNDFETNYRLGAAYYLVQDMAPAEVFFQHAVNSYHEREIISYDYTLYRLGLSQYAQGKMQLAEATLRGAVELDPKMVGYHLALGAALRYQGKLSEAKKQLELELSLEADPEASKMLDEVDASLNSSTLR
jgi:tetratricopeptide (TPR) repeat protein